ncbi:substrate-binding domain-containing protein [Terrabacter sp. BE26]|uniref:substrate-binding domain-containing protein n=1 Tax=Terrabacter sp. BE26 TaxID=2898152 RepID=UPI0035BE1043
MMILLGDEGLFVRSSSWTATPRATGAPRQHPKGLRRVGRTSGPRGELEPGAQLPSVRALADRLGTNVNTVRAAYARLQTDGLVQTRHGVGTVVLPASADRLAHGAPRLVSNTIAVLIAALDPFYLSLLRGVEDVAAERGTLVLLADTQDSPALATATIRRLVARGVDGIIAVSAGGVEDETGRDRSRRRSPMPPIVYVDQPDRKGFSVVLNGDRAGYLATRHLVEHGHERIGLVTAPLSWPNVSEIHRGYLRALSEAGGHPLVAEMEEFTLEAGRKGIARLLDGPAPCSAVFATGDELTLGVVQEARGRGLEVPGELAVIGYPDLPAAALVDPPLTMISVPAHDVGVAAMRTLQALIAGTRPSPQRVVFDTELIVRASCGGHPSPRPAPGRRAVLDGP